MSFVDPENEELAQLAATYIRRAGLTPYLAKDDHHTSHSQTVSPPAHVDGVKPGGSSTGNADRPTES